MLAHGARVRVPARATVAARLRAGVRAYMGARAKHARRHASTQACKQANARSEDAWEAPLINRPPHSLLVPCTMRRESRGRWTTCGHANKHAGTQRTHKKADNKQASKQGRGRPGPSRHLAAARRTALALDAVGPHHLVVLVLQDVAVPDVKARDVKGGRHLRDLAGVCDHRVLPTILRGHPRQWQAELRVAGVKISPPHHPELDEVQVNGVRILRPVPKVPELGEALPRPLRDRVGPH
mmetsp:Transcript_1205/g.4120  ORF Transcript_1205/g.4120 Transcript_1205/m.4120 type:complete len:239 (-) Transcript_1205:1715-2431(-)